jgi:cell wall-associated NlpC family hydrolase
MSRAPTDLDRPRVRELLNRVRSVEGIGQRLDAISRQFMGTPYISNPLGGGPSDQEVLSLSLKGFDCVTLVEYALALARSDTPARFVECLQSLRYSNGVVAWARRNHYMSGWIRTNVRAGFVRNVTTGPGMVARERFLDVVDGIKGRKVSVKSLPKRLFMRRISEVSNGDLVFFASTRSRLDVFHCGVLSVDQTGEVCLRHAARSRGQVVEQTLPSFLDANRMSGLILVRPMESPIR